MNLNAIKQFRSEHLNLTLGIEHDIGVTLANFVAERGIKSVVETGVHWGFSSWYFLEALKETDGRLWSIEPFVKDPLVVPDELRENWELIHGVSPARLVQLFKEIGNVDLFWHDSEHNFSMQLGEYVVAADHVKFLGSHDINRTGAWILFKKLFQEWEVVLQENKFGILEKGKSK